MVGADPAAEFLPQLKAGLERVPLDARILQAAPEPPDEDVIEPPASILLDTRQASTLGVAQSMTATRQRKPLRIGMRLRRARPPADRRQLHLRPQPPYPLAADRVALPENTDTSPSMADPSKEES